MRILTPKQFLDEPLGVVYVHFIPTTFVRDLSIKREERGKDSWYATNIVPWVSEESEFDKWEKDNLYELETEGFTTDDATYNHDDILYAVFNKEEVSSMIERLQKSLGRY